MFSAVQKALKYTNQPCSVSMLIAEKDEAIWEAFKIAFQTVDNQISLKHKTSNSFALYKI